MAARWPMGRVSSSVDELVPSCCLLGVGRFPLPHPANTVGQPLVHTSFTPSHPTFASPAAASSPGAEASPPASASASAVPASPGSHLVHMWGRAPGPGPPSPSGRQATPHSLRILRQSLRWWQAPCHMRRRRA